MECTLSTAMMARKYGNDDCNGHGEYVHVSEYELVYYTRSRPMGTQEIRQDFDPDACEDPFMKTLGPLVSQKYMVAVTGNGSTWRVISLQRVPRNSGECNLHSLAHV